MRKRYFYTIICFLFLLSGCLKEENNLFSEPAAVRLNKAIEGIDSVLTHSPNGWLMQYFAGSESPGYSLLASFGVSGEVKVAANNRLFNNTYTEATSCFDVIGDNGPVLTFNTFNNILHYFSNPVDPNGLGLGGDYEFVVHSYSDSLIVLSGKKWGTSILMKRLDETANWSDYLNSISEMETILFSFDSPNLDFVVDGVSTDYVFSDGSTSIFTVKSEQTDSTYSYPFIITTTGFRLYNAEVLSGKEAQNFVLNSDKSALVSTEDSNVKLIGPDDLVSYISETSVNWVLNESSMSNDVKMLFTQIRENIEGKYSGASNVYLAVRKLKKEGVFSLLLGFTYNRKDVEADLYFDYRESEANVLTLSYSSKGNSAGIALSKSVSGYLDLANLISSSFQLSTDAPVCPKIITFTKQSDKGTWFVASRD